MPNNSYRYDPNKKRWVRSDKLVKGYTFRQRTAKKLGPGLVIEKCGVARPLFLKKVNAINFCIRLAKKRKMWVADGTGDKVKLVYGRRK
jgi:hypothetical protein